MAATSPGTIIALSLLLHSCTNAFHVGTSRAAPGGLSSTSFAAVPRSRAASQELLSRGSPTRLTINTWQTALYAKNDDDTSTNGVNGAGRVPFFSRIAKRFSDMNNINSNDDAPSNDTAEEDSKSGGIAVAVKEAEHKESEHEKALVASAAAASAVVAKSPTDLATELKLQAEQARLEAQIMDTKLTIEKISKLEARLDGNGLKAEEESDIRRQIAVLKAKLDGTSKMESAAPLASTASTSSAVPSPESASSTASTPTSTASASNSSSDDDISSLIAVNESEKNKSATTIELEKKIPPISEKELKERSEAFLRTPKVLQQMTAAAAGFKDTTNVTGIIKQMHKDEQMEILKKKARERKKPEPLDEKTFEQALEGYMNLPLPIQDMIARSAGLENGRNATDVISKLEKDGRLFPNEDGMQAGFEVSTDIVDSSEIDVIFQDMKKLEKDKYIESMLPSETRKVEGIPTDEDINVFFSQVLSNKNFNPTDKPVNIPGGFLIRGENRMKDGYELVETLEKKLAVTNVSNKVQFYYIKDPNPSTEEEFRSYMNDLPVIVVTGKDIEPETKFMTKAIISILGIFFIASFSVGALSFNEVLVDRLDAEVQAGTGELSWIQSLSAPTFLAICMSQLVHEASHQAVAFKDKFKAGLPTVVPSLQTGLSGAVTPLKSPPPNLKSLFDFSMAGPLSGLIISLFFMYSGLELTAFMSPEAQSQLPGLPLQLVRSSALAGGMVEWLLGEGILALTPNEGATVLLHPFAIAGFVGLISNALALLPIGSKCSIGHSVAGIHIIRTHHPNISISFIFSTLHDRHGRWPYISITVW